MTTSPLRLDSAPFSNYIHRDLMSLTTQLKWSIRAGVPAIWIDTYDSIGAEIELRLLSQELPMTFCPWDLVRGVAIPHPPRPCAGDPVGAAGLGNEFRIAGQPTVILLHNFHWFLDRVEVVQALLNGIALAPASGTTIVIAAPRITLPLELESQIAFLEPVYPDFEEVRNLTASASGEKGLDFDSLMGLTTLEVRSIVQQLRCAQQPLPREVLQERRAEMVARRSLLQRQTSHETFGTLYGMSYLQEHCLKLLPGDGPVSSRGLFLAGPPGSGTTAFALALGNETGRGVFTLDWPRIGASPLAPGRELRQSLRRLEAMAPAILLLDEISTYICQLAAALPTDRPTRLWAQLVEWLSLHTSDVFTIGTGNAYSNIPQELLHPERLSEVFFIDLQSQEVRDLIWRKFREEHEVAPVTPPPASQGWTGAEIRACCRRAAQQDCSVSHIAEMIIPHSVVAAEHVETLRNWASGRAHSVEGPEVFRYVPQWVNRRFVDPNIN